MSSALPAGPRLVKAVIFGLHGVGVGVGDAVGLAVNVGETLKDGVWVGDMLNVGERVKLWVMVGEFTAQVS